MFPLAPAKWRHHVSRTGFVRHRWEPISAKDWSPGASSALAYCLQLWCALPNSTAGSTFTFSDTHPKQWENQTFDAVGGPDRAREAAACSSPKASCFTHPLKLQYGLPDIRFLWRECNAKATPRSYIVLTNFKGIIPFFKVFNFVPDSSGAVWQNYLSWQTV